MLEADRVFVRTKNYHQRGATNYDTGNLKYEQEKTDGDTTALGGLPLYLDLAKVIGLTKSIQKHLTAKKGS